MNALSRLLKMSGDGRDIDVPVRIEWPVEDRAAWFCRWEIRWPDRTRSNAARGSDAIQAIINALQMIGAELYGSDEHVSGQLSWMKPWVG